MSISDASDKVPDSIVGVMKSHLDKRDAELARLRQLLDEAREIIEDCYTRYENAWEISDLTGDNAKAWLDKLAASGREEER